VTTQIDEPRIRQMVVDFYGRVRRDPMLGPVFESRLDGRWPAHLDKMVDFWMSALLAAGRYSGNPRATHSAIPELSSEHFERWLELFEDTLGEMFDEPTAASIHRRARAMAQALMQGARIRRAGLPMTEAAAEARSSHGRPTSDQS